MTDDEFYKHFQVMYDTWHKHSLPDWTEHVKSNLHMLPIECVEMIAQGEPRQSGWTPDVIKAAEYCIAEHYLLNE